MHIVRGSFVLLEYSWRKWSVSGPYEILDELHMDNIDKSSLESNSIEEKHDIMMMPSTWSHKVSNPSWAKGICADKGRWFITWRNSTLMDHIARKNSTMTGGASYLWRIIIDEENMIKRSNLIAGVLEHPFFHCCQRARECWRARILPSMTNGEIFNSYCHWC